MGFKGVREGCCWSASQGSGGNGPLMRELLGILCAPSGHLISSNGAARHPETIAWMHTGQGNPGKPSPTARLDLNEVGHPTAVPRRHAIHLIHDQAQLRRWQGVWGGIGLEQRGGACKRWCAGACLNGMLPAYPCHPKKHTA